MRARSLAVLLVTCALACRPRPEGTGRETDPARPVQAAPGQVFEVRIPANESTGYHWALAVPLDSTLLAQRGHRYIPSDRSGRRAGAGGMDVWRFEAIRPGRTGLSFHYRRAAEPPAELRRFAVEIR